MEANKYQELAMRTNDGKTSLRLDNIMKKNEGYDIGGILYACLGLSGESGEFTDMIKKWIFHEKELDIYHLKRECGDVLWYIAMLCHSFGWDMEEIMQMNIDKLKARYPDGFDVNRANNRSEDDI
jgi:NTP pyrophosphatase (non-canonical NTP hydrolase)